MPRLKLVVAYHGARYAGWQLQAFRSKERPPTVQGELERALQILTGERVAVHGSGRTDSGVHAEGQVCHCDVPEGRNIAWLRALNVKLPPDVRVLSVEECGPDFHARKSALSKRYAYSLWMHTQKAPPRIAPFVWSIPEANLDAAAEAASLLGGTHDFASFRNTGTPQENTVRTLYGITARPGFVGPLACPPHWPVITYIFHGNGFLKQMVRNLMGCMVWAALGKLRAGDVPNFLEARDRRALPSPSAPAQGLTLLEVIYPEAVAPPPAQGPAPNKFRP